jgi:hypothetical protein
MPLGRPVGPDSRRGPACPQGALATHVEPCRSRHRAPGITEPMQDARLRRCSVAVRGGRSSPMRAARRVERAQPSPRGSLMRTGIGAGRELLVQFLVRARRRKGHPPWRTLAKGRVFTVAGERVDNVAEPERMSDARRSTGKSSGTSSARPSPVGRRATKGAGNGPRQEACGSWCHEAGHSARRWECLPMARVLR